ncbi:hypothetical protein [Reichenbachiella sp.]|uniref:hypothetical protein n=1 Tax=Reichenbachiella sp. TaxID=2184521 RepID=UPI003B596DEA
MKLFLKVLKIGLLIFFITFGILAFSGWILQERITNYAIEEIGSFFDAPLGKKKVSFSLIKDFPYGSIQFEDLWLGAYVWDQNHEIVGIDTLAKMQNLSIAINTKEMLNGVFNIRNVEIQNGYLRYEIDTLGGTNFDFLMSSDTVIVEEDIESEPLDLNAEGIKLSNFSLIYKDDQQKIKSKVYIPKINGAVRLKDPKAFAHFKGDLEITALDIEDTHLDRMKKANLSVNLTYKTDTLEFESLKIQTAEINVSSQGKLILGDQIYANLNTTIKAPSLAKLTKYAPDGILASNGINQLSGSLDMTSRVEGMLGEDELPHYEIALKYEKGSIKYENYPLIYNIAVDTEVTNGAQNNNTTTAIKLSELAASISGNKMVISGDFSNLDRLKYNLKSSLELDFDESKEIIPDSIAQDIGGKINLQLATKGTAPDSVTSDFVKSALAHTIADVTFENFKLKMDESIHLKKMNGKLSYSDNSISLKNLSTYLPEYKVELIKNSFDLRFDGDPMKPETLNINIPSFHLATTEGTVDGSAKLNQLKHLEFVANNRLDLDLSKIKRFTSDTLVNDMSGSIQASIQTKGKLNIEKMSDSEIEAILYDNTNIELKLSQVYLDMKDTLMNVKNLRGKITKNHHNIAINGLKGGYQGISFDIQTTVENAINTALRNQPGTLKVNSDIKLGDLDYRALAAFIPQEAEQAPSPEKAEPIHWNYEITGEASIKSFTYDDSRVEGISASFNANDANNLAKSTIEVKKTRYGQTAAVNNLTTKLEVDLSNMEVKGKLAISDIKYEDAILDDISALYNVSDTVYTIDQFKFNGFGGKTTSSFQFHMKPEDEMEIEMKSNISELNVRRLMKEMKNFDQKEMTYEQLNGFVSSDNLFLRMVMIGDSIVYDDLRMTCDLKFHDGGIYHYPYVQDMAQYLPKVSNLDTMRFKTIDTHMFLFKDAVYVPSTYVVTSVFDVEVMGMQSFGEVFEYHAGVNIFQVLGKNKKFNLEDKGPVKEKKMIRRMIIGKDGDFTNENSSPGKRTTMETKIKTQEKVLEFRFQPKAFNFDTGAEGI